MKRAALALCALCAMYSCTDDGGRGAARPSAPVRAVVTPVKCTVGTPLDYRIMISAPDAGKFAITLPEKGAVYPPAEDARGDGRQGVPGNTEKKARAEVPLYTVSAATEINETGEKGAARVISVRLAYFRTGNFELPRVPIGGADGVSVGYALPRVEVEATNATGQFHEIEPPREFGGYYWRMIALAGGLVLLASAGGVAWRMRGRGMPVYDAAIVSVSPLETFLGEMAVIRGERSPGGTGDKERAGAVHEAFRRFVKAECGIEAMEMTGAGLVRALDEWNARIPGGGAPGGLDRCIHLWDLAKFAEFKAPPGALLESLIEIEAIARAIAERGGRERA
ncbi:MAG: hypothetical protein EPN93_21480 [Spirochaetes bacterium]|nr:MAG: hypothetical protein EPN93_21480 [Spirochaetota bacterium]